MKSVIKPCAVALHIAKIQQLVRQFNKPSDRSEGIHLENHVVLPILSYIHKTKNTYYLESCLSYNYSHIVMIRDKKQQSVNYTMQSMYYSCGIHRFCIAQRLARSPCAKGYSESHVHVVVMGYVNKSERWCLRPCGGKTGGKHICKIFIIMNLHRSVLMEIRLVCLIDKLSGLNN